MYTIKFAQRNYAIYGIYNNDNEMEFSLTSIDFYNMFDALSQFLNKCSECPYTKPKLYKTKYDETTKGKLIVEHYFGDYYNLIIPYIPNECGINYGAYKLEELRELHQAMYGYIKTATKDMIFDCSSDDIKNINFNPYTIYMDVYPESKMTIELMLYFIASGEWHYMSRTLQENLDNIHDNFEDNLHLIENSPIFQHFKKTINKLDKKELTYQFNVLNNYKKL